MLDQGAGIGVALDVEKLIRNLAACQKIFDAVRAGRPQCARHPDPVVGDCRRSLPVADQVVQDGIEILLGRCPGLHEVVVEPDRVDRGDGRFGIGVGGEQHLACLWVDRASRGEKLRAAHLGHPLVDKKKRYGVIALLESMNGLQPSAPELALMIRNSLR